MIAADSTRNGFYVRRSHSRDAAGNLTQRVDRNGRVIEYVYDGLDRLTTEAWFADVFDTTADREIGFDYDLLGRLTASYDPDHFYEYLYGRRDLDLATSYEWGYFTGLSPGFSYSNFYDAVGNLTGTQVQVGAHTDFTNSYTYDNLNRLESVVQSYYSQTNVDRRVDFTYDLVGQFDTIKRYADLSGILPVAVSEYEFDYAGRLTEIEHRAGGTPGSGALLAGYGYDWNQRSQLTSIDFLPDGINSLFDYSDEDVDYDYDNRHQLTGADYAGLTDETYVYDENGNRISGGFTVASNNRLLSDGTYNYAYDNEGNIVLRTKISDGSYTQYTWDHRNRLVEVTDKTSDGMQTYKVVYGYDAFNRLVARTYQTTSGSAVGTGYFIHDGNQIVLILNGSGDVDHRLLWGAAVDEALADEDFLGNIYWYLTDHLGTVRDVAYHSTSTQSTTIEHTSYDSFGNITGITGHLRDFPLRFTGKWFDTATGLQWNQNRWYNPEIQRWMSEDPIGFAAGDANLYRYVGNSPTMYVDPSGLAPTEVPWRDFQGRIHDPIPKEVPKDWGVETVDEALGEVEASIENRRKKGVEAGGLNAAHDPPLKKEKTWRQKLLNRRTALQGGKKLFKKAIGPIMIGVDLYTGGPAYAANEATWPLSEIWRDDGFFDDPPGEETRPPTAPTPRPPSGGGYPSHYPIFIP